MASSSFQFNTATRKNQVLLSLGLCLIVLTGCSDGGTDEPTSDQSPTSIIVPPRTPTMSPSEEPRRPELPSGAFMVSKLLVESSLNYDACPTCSDIGFLDSVEMLTTRAELNRLQRSQRARVPWAAMQSRHERSRVEIIDIQGEPSEADTWTVVVSGTRTIRTASATSRAFVQVRLTVIPNGDGWKVAGAQGPGL